MYSHNSSLFRLFGSKNISLALATILLVLSSYSTAFAAGNSPEFDSVSFTRYSGKIYVSGYVDDSDDDVDGFVIDVGGDVTGTVVVNADGYFFVELDDPGQQSVFVVIQTEDPNGNTASDGEWLY